MRAPPLPPEDRRLLLVQASHRVFSRKGYHAASVADILAEAGVARGTFYNYFEGKREAFRAVLDAVMDRVVQGVTPISLEAPVPHQLQENLRRLVEVLDEDTCRLLFAEAPGLDAEGQVALLDFYSNATARIVRALRTGQAIGLVRAGPVEPLAWCLLGALKEPVFQAWLSGQPVDQGGLIDALLLLFSSGILSGGGVDPSRSPIF